MPKTTKEGNKASAERSTKRKWLANKRLANNLICMIRQVRVAVLIELDRAWRSQEEGIKVTGSQVKVDQCLTAGGYKELLEHSHVLAPDIANLLIVCGRPLTDAEIQQYAERIGATVCQLLGLDDEEMPNFFETNLTDAVCAAIRFERACIEADKKHKQS